MSAYRPLPFFALSLLIPWLLWFAAAYLSHHHPEQRVLQTALLLAGLLVPALLAWHFICRQPHLRRDALARLHWRSMPWPYVLLAVLLPVGSLILAQCLSVLFGHDWAQFHVSGSPSFTSALLSPWLMLILAAVLEELAWHSYGTDALLSRMNLFAASMLFTVYWALWHLPLGFVKGYYHSEMAAQGALYVANFVASMVVFVLLMNWLYIKSGRAVWMAVLFHLAANMGNEVFATHPDSKVIQTVLLAGVAAYLLRRDADVFFRQPQGG